MEIPLVTKVSEWASDAIGGSFCFGRGKSLSSEHVDGTGLAFFRSFSHEGSSDIYRRCLLI